MMTPVIPFSFKFTSDGTSTALALDLTTAPTSLDLRGAQIAGVQDVAIGASGTVPTGVASLGVSAVVNGTQIVLTFPTTLPTLDVNSALEVYTVSGLLQLVGASITLPL